MVGCPCQHGARWLVGGRFGSWKGFATGTARQQKNEVLMCFCARFDRFGKKNRANGEVNDRAVSFSWPCRQTCIYALGF